MRTEIIDRVEATASPQLIPLAADSVRAGFPSPADNYLETELDLMDHLVQHSSATFYVRTKGESMMRHGIHIPRLRAGVEVDG